MFSMETMLTIGGLARLTGVETKTLRYYDRVGLVPPGARTASRYRLYNEDAVDRLQFIRGAKALGMSLADIGRILAVRDDGAAPCQHVLDLATRQAAKLEAQIRHLKSLRRDLLRLRRDLRRRISPKATAVDDCPCFAIIRAFEKPERRRNQKHGHG